MTPTKVQFEPMKHANGIGSSAGASSLPSRRQSIHLSAQSFPRRGGTCSRPFASSGPSQVPCSASRSSIVDLSPCSVRALSPPPSFRQAQRQDGPDGAVRHGRFSTRPSPETPVIEHNLHARHQAHIYVGQTATVRELPSFTSKSQHLLSRLRRWKQFWAVPDRSHRSACNPSPERMTPTRRATRRAADRIGRMDRGEYASERIGCSRATPCGVPLGISYDPVGAGAVRRTNRRSVNVTHKPSAIN